MLLRDYQQDAVEPAWERLKKSTLPLLMTLCTGAGKSYCLAALAHRIYSLTGKRVLVTAPSAEIVMQNAAKYIETGERASIFSASAGEKCVRFPVVFGSPLSIKNSIELFTTGDYGAIFVDECHLWGATLTGIVDAMTEANPNLRLLGCTATPFKLGKGYIYLENHEGKSLPSSLARDPVFAKEICNVGAGQLIDMGFLSPVVVGKSGTKTYDTTGLKTNSMGQYTADSVSEAFIGHGRLTSDIVADVLAQSSDRNLVMFFASTIQHAEEIAASLPIDGTHIITGKTPKKDRSEIIRISREGGVKYLVSVGALTTGTDIPIADVCAVLRATESPGLFIQVVGRVLRIHKPLTEVYERAMAEEKETVY